MSDTSSSRWFAELQLVELYIVVRHLVVIHAAPLRHGRASYFRVMMKLAAS